MALKKKIMKLEWLVYSILLTCSMVILGTNPTRSEEISIKEFQKRTPANNTTTSYSQQGSLSSKVQSVKSTAEIRQVNKIERPISNAQILVQTPTPTTPAQKIVQVTGVKANPTDKGVEVILQTSLGEQLQITNRSAVNSFIVDIPNAQLRLPSGEAFTFCSDKPIAGITGITVTNFDANTIRVTVTGEAGVPTVELFDSPNEGLIFSVASAAASSQPSAQSQTQPTPQPNQPANQTPPTQPSDEPIELVVTGEQDGYRVGDSSTPTKTDTPLRDIPQSIQVIPRQLIEEQRITRVSDALRNVSGIQESASTTRNVFDVPIYPRLYP